MTDVAPYELTISEDLAISIHRNSCPKDSSLAQNSPVPSSPLPKPKTRWQLCRWQGRIVRHLFESSAIPLECQRVGTYPCDKCVVWHLILAATAARCILGNSGDDWAKTSPAHPPQSFAPEPVQSL